MLTITRKSVSLLVGIVLAILFIGFLPRTAGAAPATIQNYPMPSIYTASSIYSLKADSQSIPVISYKDDYDYAEFSFDGTVSIEVTANVPITSYSISPMAKNIEGTVNGNKLTFSLSSSTYVIVTINDQTKKIVIAADPLETNIPPSTGAGIYNVTQSPYNADNTGTSMASNAIQQAIDAANQAGGGIVYVPAGIYKSGNLTLKSNVTFYLAGGAVILGTGKGEDYVIDFRKDSRNADGTYFIRTAVDSSNITIRGRGTIDGKGIAMRERKMPAPNKNEGFLNNLLVPLATTNFNFDGLILRDAGFWAFMVVRSDNVTIKNLKGFQDLYKIENDIIDINESQNVLVKHAIAISDDDTYSTKTWLQTGMSSGWPGALEHLENVVFDDALAWTRCAAFKIGQGVAQAQIGVTVRNSYVYQSARALLVDHGYTLNTLPEEGYAQNITFENIDIERVGINQFGNHWLTVSTSTSGNVNNVVLKNINLRQLGSEQSRLSGNVTKGGMVNGVMFSDVYVKGKLATNLTDLKVSVINDNVSGIIFANTNPLFSDNFEDGDTTGWTSVTGSWSVPTVDTNKLLSSGSQTTTSLIIANPGVSWTDYTYEAKVEMGITNANAGVVFRVQDANNYYMYRINASTQKLELYKSINGQMTLVTSTPFTAIEKQSYTMKAVIEGNKISCYVDGEFKMTWTNPITELTTGGIGFRTTSMGVHFDDAMVYPTVRLNDNFEDGNMIGWTSESGSWSVLTDGTKVLNQNNSTTALVTAGDSWTNYTYEVKVKMPITNANAGIVFRLQNADNYYMYRINASNQKLELFKAVNGQLTMVSSTSFTAQSNQWYTIKASIQDNTIKGYVDGVLKTQWTNPATELTTGKIGFRTTSVDVSFDDALVVSYNE